MKKSLIGIIALVLSFQAFSQEKKDDNKQFGIKVSGFVKTDFFYDTRQTVSAREGYFLLWPAGENIDFEGNDINDIRISCKACFL